MLKKYLGRYGLYWKHTLPISFHIPSSKLSSGSQKSPHIPSPHYQIITTLASAVLNDMPKAVPLPLQLPGSFTCSFSFFMFNESLSLTFKVLDLFPLYTVQAASLLTFLCCPTS